MDAQRRTRRVALGLAALVGLIWTGLWMAGHFFRRDPAVLHVVTGEAFGAPYTITLTLPPAAEAPTDLDMRIHDIFDRVRTLMSTDVADSEIARFNASTSTEPVSFSPETAEVVACALKVSDQTAGAFDLTGQQTGMSKLAFDAKARTLRKLDPAVTINIDALLPAYAQDQIARALETEGFVNYLIDFDTRWTERAASPDSIICEEFCPPRDGTDAVTIHAAAADPLIDGRTGQPANTDIVEVTVMHESCLYADAYARAVLVLGADDAILLAKILKLPVRITVLQPDGTSTDRMTPEMEQYFPNMIRP